MLDAQPPQQSNAPPPPEPNATHIPNAPHDVPHTTISPANASSNDLPASNEPPQPSTSQGHFSNEIPEGSEGKRGRSSENLLDDGREGKRRRSSENLLDEGGEGKRRRSSENLLDEGRESKRRSPDDSAPKEDSNDFLQISKRYRENLRKDMDEQAEIQVRFCWCF